MMMRRLTFLLLSIIVCSCIHQGEPRVWNYSIVNNSGKTISLIPFFLDGKDISRKIVIANGDKLEKKMISKPPYDELTMQDLIANGDGFVRGVEIVFDNEKKIMYDICEMGVCDNPRNIFHFSNNTEYTSKYIFTVTDYENATDCGGNCN